MGRSWDRNRSSPHAALGSQTWVVSFPMDKLSVFNLWARGPQPSGPGPLLGHSLFRIRLCKQQVSARACMKLPSCKWRPLVLTHKAPLRWAVAACTHIWPLAFVHAPTPPWWAAKLEKLGTSALSHHTPSILRDIQISVENRHKDRRKSHYQAISGSWARSRKQNKKMSFANSFLVHMKMKCRKEGTCRLAGFHYYHFYNKSSTNLYIVLVS